MPLSGDDAHLTAHSRRVTGLPSASCRRGLRGHLPRRGPRAPAYPPRGLHRSLGVGRAAGVGPLSPARPRIRARSARCDLRARIGSGPARPAALRSPPGCARLRSSPRALSALRRRSGPHQRRSTNTPAPRPDPHDLGHRYGPRPRPMPPAGIRPRRRRPCRPGRGDHERPVARASDRAANGAGSSTSRMGLRSHGCARGIRRGVDQSRRRAVVRFPRSRSAAGASRRRTIVSL